MAKQIKAWGIRRKEVDINQLALAYYLLARARVEQAKQHREAQPPGDESDDDDNARDGRAA